jgi:hypothetical protein
MVQMSLLISDYYSRIPKEAMTPSMCVICHVKLGCLTIL